MQFFNQAVSVFHVAGPWLGVIGVLVLDYLIQRNPGIKGNNVIQALGHIFVAQAAQTPVPPAILAAAEAPLAAPAQPAAPQA